MIKIDIEALERRYKANLINSLSGFKSLNLIGTCDEDGNTNLAIFNSVFHLGADPPLIGFISRPNSVPRHTIENIRKSSHYTINPVTKDNYQQAHQTSARYAQKISEFEACGLEYEYIKEFKVPFVKNSPIKIGVDFVREVPIMENDTILVIGQIVLLEVPDIALNQDGFLNLEQLGIVCGSSLDSYHLTEQISRLAYAKPNKS